MNGTSETISASYASLPMPGILNTVSVIIAPPNRLGRMPAIIVTSGIIVLRNACL